ncbi:hypothetical protein AYI69_g9679 [Smittium culicis]|uniref:CCHC-type domain-containing protein n=1 Tax=Smittium culicis TaxID=133412 RepID=A0A1R1XB28_9FUNG|nr:hypothetical protein AYI69_g9679 [Smittium culicis]
MEQAKLPISFEGLPKRFKGDEKDNDTVEIWTSRFVGICKLKGWNDSESVEVFKIWLEGPAAKCLYDKEKLAKDDKQPIEWNLEKLSEALTVEFQDFKKLIKHDIFTLSEIKKKDTESLEEFNTKYVKYLEKIPESMYTKDSIKEMIKGNILEDEILIPKSEPEVFIPIPPVAEPVKKKKEESVINNSVQCQIDQLGKKFSDMMLKMGRQRNPPFDNKNYQCFNCGEYGHGTRMCNKERNPELNAKLYEAYINKNAPPNSENHKSMLLVQSNTEDNLALNAAHKRMRVEDLLDNRVVLTEVSRATATSSPKTAKKKKNVEKKKNTQIGTISVMPSRFLDSNAPMTIRELFVTDPRYLNDTIIALQQLKNN